MQSITAYQLPAAELEEDEDTAVEDSDRSLEEGQMVRVDQDAVKSSGIDEAEANEEFDDEYNYEQYGYVFETHEDDFRWYDEEEDEAIDVDVDDETIYIVGMAPLEAGAHPFVEADLTPVDGDVIMDGLDIEPRPDEAEEEMDDSGSEEENAYAVMDDVFDLEEASDQLGYPIGEVEELADVSDVPGITRNDVGLSPWPRSWRESDKPARLIALDTWQSVGGTFRGCRRSMVGRVKNPNKLCASWKDALYGHTYWRGGGG